MTQPQRELTRGRAQEWSRRKVGQAGMHREHLEICSVPETQREAPATEVGRGPHPQETEDSPAQSAKKSSSLARSQDACGTMPCT